MVAGLAYKNLEIEKWTNILTSEANLEPSKTSMTEHFCQNNQQLKVVDYIFKKAPSQMFGWALNTPLYLICLTYQNVRQHQENGRWTST